MLLRKNITRSQTFYTHNNMKYGKIFVNMRMLIGNRYELGGNVNHGSTYALLLTRVGFYKDHSFKGYSEGRLIDGKIIEYYLNKLF